MGGLYRFKDILPRVIVCGYSLEKNLKPVCTSEHISEQLDNVKSLVITLSKNNFEEYFTAISDVKNKKTQKLKMYLENEILLDTELPFIRL